MKLRGMAVQPCLHLKFVMCVLDTPQNNVLSCMEIVPTILKHCMWCTHEHRDNEITWDDRRPYMERSRTSVGISYLL